MRDRLKDFALQIFNLSDMFPNSTKGKVINNQITKSGTSMYANYRAALRGRSKREFFSKISIVVEDADETEMWLELILDSNIINNEVVKKMHVESVELIKILSSMRKRLDLN